MENQIDQKQYNGRRQQIEGNSSDGLIRFHGHGGKAEQQRECRTRRRSDQQRE